MRIAIIAVALSCLAAPIAATAQAMPGDPVGTDKPVRIVVDNRAPCFGGRIGQMRENNARIAAKQEARRLRKLGYTVVGPVTLPAGVDRTAADIGARIFTSIC